VRGFQPNGALITHGVNEIGPYITRSPDARKSIGELIVFDGLLIAGYSDRTDGVMVRLDLYNPLTGEYLATVPMPEGFTDVAIDKTGVYVLSAPDLDRPQRLIRYEWRRPDAQRLLSGKTSSNP
jgi:hypothetical protein